MTGKNFTTNISVAATPAEAFAAINDVRGWWSEEIEGSTDALGAEFTFLVPNVHYSKLRITELVPDSRVVWHVEEAYLYFADDKTEWVGTDIVFAVTAHGGQTEVHFTHNGLVPDFGCYDQCTQGWQSYISGSLRDLITTGKGDPFRAGGTFETELAKHRLAIG